MKIIDEASEIGVPALKFNWRGEPTLNPHFSNIIHYAKRKESFHDLIVNTNGNCPREALAGLVDCTKVVVSIDSMDFSTYHKSRVGGSLIRAMCIIDRLVEQGHKNIWIRRVLTKLNQNENFEAAVRKEWGDKVKVSQHFCFDRNALQKTETTTDSAKEVARRYCGYPSQRLIISSEGKIFPCCVDYYETMPIGNYPETGLLKAWHDVDIHYLRTDLKQNKYREKVCQNCTSWMSYDTPQRNYIGK